MEWLKAHFTEIANFIVVVAFFVSLMWILTSIRCTYTSEEGTTLQFNRGAVSCPEVDPCPTDTPPIQ
jgi:hypothetical protein